MQTTVVVADNNNNANNTTIGDCARLLVAAGLPLLLTPAEDGGAPPPLPLSFEALLATIRQRPLLAAADRLFAGFVAMAEVRHGVFSSPLKRDTRTLLSGFLIAAHPVTVFEQPRGPLETNLSDAAAAFLRTFGRLVLLASAQQQQQDQPLLLLPFELTAELLPQMAAYEAAHAAWTSADVPRLVSRLETGH
jgi:hypothetical protein